MNLFEKISKIMENVKGLAKDTEVFYNGKVQYKALSENKVTKVLREQLIKHKIVVYPTQQVYSRNGNISIVNTRYRMVNAENPVEYIELASSGEGSDTQDKGAGKAMTYAFKYMLLRTFAIPTGEDADFIHSDTLTDMQNQMEQGDVILVPAGCTPMITERQKGCIAAGVKRHPHLEAYLRMLLSDYGVTKTEELTKQQASEVIGKLKERADGSKGTAD